MSLLSNLTNSFSVFKSTFICILSNLITKNSDQSKDQSPPAGDSSVVKKFSPNYMQGM